MSTKAEIIWTNKVKKNFPEVTLVKDEFKHILAMHGDEIVSVFDLEHDQEIFKESVERAFPLLSELLLEGAVKRAVFQLADEAIDQLKKDDIPATPRNVAIRMQQLDRGKVLGDSSTSTIEKLIAGYTD